MKENVYVPSESSAENSGIPLDGFSYTSDALSSEEHEYVSLLQTEESEDEDVITILAIFPLYRYFSIVTAKSSAATTAFFMFSPYLA